MRVAIYGAGSLGTILGAYISRGGEKIELINRNKAHVEALQTQGAHIIGTVQFVQPVVAYTPAEMISINRSFAGCPMWCLRLFERETLYRKP